MIEDAIIFEEVDDMTLNEISKKGYINLAQKVIIM